MDDLPDLVIENIAQYCDIDTLLSLYNSLGSLKRSCFPFKILRSFKFDFHDSKNMLTKINKYLRTKELCFTLQAFHPTIDTWRILEDLCNRKSFISSVKRLDISDVQLNFNGRNFDMSNFQQLIEAVVRNLNLFEFSKCLALKILTEIHNWDNLDIPLPSKYQLPHNLEEFACFRNNVSFIPNDTLVYCNITNSDVINKELFIKLQKLKKLCCAIKSTEGKDFACLRSLEELDLTIEQNFCSVVKLSKTVRKLKIYKYCFLYGIAVVDIYFDDDCYMPNLSNVEIYNCFVRFYHDLKQGCSLNVSQGKIVIKKIGKYLRMDRNRISRSKRSNKDKIFVKSFFK